MLLLRRRRRPDRACVRVHRSGSHSARAAARDAGVEHDGLYGAASCVAAVGQPATEEEQSHTQLLSPRTKACIAAALPLKHHANAAPGPDAYRHFSAYDQAEMPE